MFASPFCAESDLISPLMSAEQMYVSADKSKQDCVSNDQYKVILSGVRDWLSVPHWVLQSLKSWTWQVDSGQSCACTTTGVQPLRRAVGCSWGSRPGAVGEMGDAREVSAACPLWWRKEEPCLMSLWRDGANALMGSYCSPLTVSTLVVVWSLYNVFSMVSHTFAAAYKLGCLGSALPSAQVDSNPHVLLAGETLLLFMGRRREDAFCSFLWSWKMAIRKASLGVKGRANPFSACRIRW